MRELMGGFVTAVELAVPVVAVVVVLTAVQAVRGRGRPGRAWSRTVGGGVLVGALVLVAAVTLLPRPGQTETTTMNVDLFATMARYLRHGDPVLILRNLVLNVLLFVPLGVGAALRWRSVTTATLLGAGVSLVVEGLQALLPLARAVDVDDVLLNVLGAASGAAVVALLRRLRDATRAPASEPWTADETSEGMHT